MVSPEVLTNIVTKQLHSFFKLEQSDEQTISECISTAIDRAYSCFKKVANKYYSDFSTTHSDQYAMFLYFLANEISKKKGPNETSDKIYYLNKIMHSIDLYYEVQLPEYFYWQHPVGTVLGRAHYSDFLTVYQNCTIGMSWGDQNVFQFPTLEKNVTLLAHSAVFGKSTIGENTILSAYSCVVDTDIPADSIVFGQGINLIIKPNKKNLTFFKM